MALCRDDRDLDGADVRADIYINTYAFEHVFFSETRAYMALLMGAAMAVIMLSFMLSMYSSKAINIGI